MGEVVLLLMDSLVEAFSRDVHNTKVDKVMQCLQAFRQESCIINPDTYNTFLPNLKDAVAANSQNDIWEKLKEGEYCVLHFALSVSRDKGMVLIIVINSLEVGMP